MKRNSKPFSIEIKKSRVPGQRSQLPPRRLFDLPPAQAVAVLQEDVPQAVVKPLAAPRILPSILAPAPDVSKPDGPVRRKRASVKADQDQEQMGFHLTAAASEAMTEAPAAVPMDAESMLQADIAAVAEEDAASTPDVQPAQGESVKANSRKPRKKVSAVVDQVMASEPTPRAVHRPEVEMLWPSVVTPSKSVERKLTKRQAAAVQLPRHERWKRRLHPASW